MVIRIEVHLQIVVQPRILVTRFITLVLIYHCFIQSRQQIFPPTIQNSISRIVITKYNIIRNKKLTLK